ncbi:MAG TPA: hypothetical protein PKD28_03300 [Candidatus Saccharibacteria bacterium]|nr:hypothetical protein [Candidatus Saccharibacteria bacterium]
MCNTDLKIQIINKEIAIHGIEGLILGVEKRIIALNGRICDLTKTDDGDLVEMARLKRNLAHAQLDIANYDLSIAQIRTQINELMQEAGRMAGERMAAQFGPLFETLFGGASDATATGDFMPAGFGDGSGIMAGFPSMMARG